MGDYMAINLYQYFEKYSKEEIDLVINSLSLEYQNLIRRLYDKNGYFIDKNLLTRKDYLDSEYLLIVLLPRKLENVHIINTSSIYDLFYEYKAYLIDEIVSLLSDNYKEIIFQRERFLSSQDNNYTVEDNKVFFNSIYPLVGELLKEYKITKDKENFKIGKGKSLYDLLALYKNYSKDEIMLVIDGLSLEERNLVFLGYDSALKKKIGKISLENSELSKYKNLIYRKIPRLLANKDKYVKKLGLFLRFKEYPENEILQVINSLSSEEKELLRLRYDDNYNFKEEFIYLDEEVKQKIYKIVGKMKMILCDFHKRNSYLNDLFYKYNNYSKEEILNVVEDLSFKERALFNLRYDEEYNLKQSFYALDSKTKQKVYIFFSGVFRNRLEAFKTKANRNKYIFKRIEVARYILENSYLKELNALLDNKVLMVILMEKGYINGYCYSRMEISILLDMDIVLIEDILKMYDKKDKVLRLEKKEDGQI